PFLLKDSGNAYSSGELSAQFREWSNEAGLPQGCTFHGLRATGCTRFAEAGCTPHEIAAWSGHKALQQVDRYTRSPHQKRLADQRTGTHREQMTVKRRSADCKTAVELQSFPTLKKSGYDPLWVISGHRSRSAPCPLYP